MFELDGEEYHLLTCYRCTIRFYVAVAFYTNRKRDGGKFYCPVGHVQVFAKSEDEQNSATYWMAEALHFESKVKKREKQLAEKEDELISDD